LLLALVPQLFGHSTFNWALRYLSVAFVSITLLGEPIGSTILAYLLLEEIPSGLKIFGAILILVGIYTAARSENNASGAPSGNEARNINFEDRAGEERQPDL
jgi:drug/metabolite transporter (DMT)-like permease